MRLIAAALAACVSLSAQSLIVSVPSADVSRKGELMLAFEGQYNRLRSGTYFNSFTFSTYGVGHHTELAATLFGVSSPSSNNRALGMGFKTVLPLRGDLAERREVKAGVGAMVPVSFDGKGAGYWVFSNFSFRAPGARTRFTVGPSVGTRQIFGRTAYATLLGVEQPLSKRWSFVADWFSGRHDLGAAVFAMSYHVDPRTMVIFGWKVSNNARNGPPAAMVEVTRTFGGH